MTVHIPVLADEVVAALALQPRDLVVDGTLGGGGHTERLLQVVGPEGRVVALDRDPRAIAAARTRFRGRPVDVVHANYCELPEVLRHLGIERVRAIVLDLGLSSDQLADPARGFSFASEGELDLRFDPDEGEPAWRLLERLSERELADLIYQFGEERYSRRIARAIVETRRREEIRKVPQLAQLVRRCVRRSPGLKIDPATRTFQALRIAVNRELESLTTGLKVFPDCLGPQGRVAIISFHSLEDRIVKHTFREDPRYDVLTKKPIRPNEVELRLNARSRSARLRVARRSAS